MSLLRAVHVSALCLSLAAGLAACGAAAEETTAVDPDAGLTLTAIPPVDAGRDTSDAVADAHAVYTPSAPVPAPKKKQALGPYPIVLMHGMAGFNQLANLPVTISYFNGVQADLKAHGEPDVFVTVAPPYDTSEVRAASLAPQLDAILKQTGAAKLNLIGHSQGGMDARVLVSAAGLGYADRVASVTTIATPHRGTKVADLALGLVSGPAGVVVGDVANDFLGLLEQGVYSVDTDPRIVAQGTELSTSYMANTFNPTYLDAPGVTYASYAGRTDLESGRGDCDDAVYANEPAAKDIAQVELEATASYLELEGETSDGLVPVSSAKWGTFMECIPADHLKEVGMIDQNGPDPVSGYDHLVFFRAVVARLRAQGF
jgi:triacylglycerol lipase